MNPEALARLRSVLQTHVDQGLLPGAVALVHHRGQTVLHEAVGHQRPPSAETATPAMAPDTVFRIYSMTKPIASLVAMMLMEEGRLLLSHPVARYLPAFAAQQVYDPATGATTPAPREATVHDLLRHTAGLSYAWDLGTV
ncbi:MAG: beta-lactamase family protein, partial [Acidovorax sp.]|nr:beta-lactamase family protein [Acidovorax sp.]